MYSSVHPQYRNLCRQNINFISFLAELLYILLSYSYVLPIITRSPPPSGSQGSLCHHSGYMRCNCCISGVHTSINQFLETNSKCCYVSIAGTHCYSVNMQYFYLNSLVSGNQIKLGVHLL